MKSLLEVEADFKDRPWLWHLKNPINQLSGRMIKSSDIEVTSQQFGLDISDFISRGTFNNYDVIYARNLIEYRREGIEKGFGRHNHASP